MDSRTYYYARVSSKEQNLDQTDLPLSRLLGQPTEKSSPTKKAARIWSGRVIKPSKTQCSDAGTPWLSNLLTD